MFFAFYIWLTPVSVYSNQSKMQPWKQDERFKIINKNNAVSVRPNPGNIYCQSVHHFGPDPNSL